MSIQSIPMSNEDFMPNVKEIDDERQEFLICLAAMKGRRNGMVPEDQKTISKMNKMTHKLKRVVRGSSLPKETFGEWSDTEIYYMLKAERKGRRPVMTDDYSMIVSRPCAEFTASTSC